MLLAWRLITWVTEATITAFSESLRRENVIAQFAQAGADDISPQLGIC